MKLYAILIPLLICSGVAQAKESIVLQCERLAGHPEDTTRSKGVAGVDGEKVDKELAWSVCQKAFQSAPSNRTIQYNVGRALFLRNSAKEAFPYYEMAAKAKHPHALYWVGRWYVEGTIVPLNKALGFAHLEEAHQLGSKYALLYLVKEYVNSSKNQNCEKGIPYLQLAVNRKYVEALSTLAWAHYWGDCGIEKNVSSAEAVFLEAEQLGYTDAKAQRERMYTYIEEAKKKAEKREDANRRYRACQSLSMNPILCSDDED